MMPLPINNPQSVKFATLLGYLVSNASLNEIGIADAIIPILLQMRS
jgi:hypothetical protein